MATPVIIIQDYHASLHLIEDSKLLKHKIINVDVHKTPK